MSPRSCAFAFFKIETPVFNLITLRSEFRLTSVTSVHISVKSIMERTWKYNYAPQIIFFTAKKKKREDLHSQSTSTAWRFTSSLFFF